MSHEIGTGLLPHLLPGETVLESRRWILTGSGRAGRSYRVVLHIPPIQESGIYITDRRILFVSYLFRLVLFQQSVWYPANEDADEILESAGVGARRILGSYLEVISRDRIKRWYRAPVMKLRVYTREPETLLAAIRRSMDAR